MGLLRAKAFALSLALALPAVSMVARADDAPSSAQAVAEKLFLEGRALLERGDARGALTKFEESLKYDPQSTGAMLNLAICSEQVGHLATAWVRYKEVAARSRGTRPDRVELSEQRAAALEPRLSHLTIVVSPNAQAPRLVVRLDGVVVDPATFGTAFPVDGGRHEIEASAPEKTPRTDAIEVGAEKDQKTYTVEPLVDAPRAPAESAHADEAVTPSGSDVTRRHTLGGAVLGVGLASLAAGATFGVLAATSTKPKSYSDVNAGNDAYTRINTFAWVANIAIPVGLVGGAIGAYFLVTSPSAPPARPTAHVRIVPGPGAIAVDGAF